MKTSPISLLFAVRLLWAVIALLLLTSTAQADPPPGTTHQKTHPPTESGTLRRFEFHRKQMGAPFAVAFYACDEEAANKAISAVWSRIEHLNSLMSDYDSNSELMRLCRDSGPGKPIAVTPELFFVLSKSIEISEISGGAFDVSVGPLIKLWRRARRQKELPDPQQLSEARTLVGFKNIRLCRTGTPALQSASSISTAEKYSMVGKFVGQECPTCQNEAGTVELLKPGMKLDLGGIAVGYACDEAIKILNAHGICRAMIDGSGDIVLSEPPPGECGWRIGIASLREPDAEPTSFAQLANCSISTSGDAFQFVELGGQRFSHIVDPQTGLGLTDRCSVTVIAPDGITADALATAVSVLGPERGLRLIESRPDTSALFATLNDKKLISRRSSRFHW